MQTGELTNESPLVDVGGLFTMLATWDPLISVTDCFLFRIQPIIIEKLLSVVDVYWPDINQHLQFLINVPNTVSPELMNSVHFLIAKVSSS